MKFGTLSTQPFTVVETFTFEQLEGSVVPYIDKLVDKMLDTKTSIIGEYSKNVTIIKEYDISTVIGGIDSTVVKV